MSCVPSSPYDRLGSLRRSSLRVLSLSYAYDQVPFLPTGCLHREGSIKGNTLSTKYRCNACGVFSVTDRFEAAFRDSRLGSEEQLILRGIVSEHTERFHEFEVPIGTSDEGQNSYNLLIRQYGKRPQTALAQLHLAVNVLARNADHVGADSTFADAGAFARMIYLAEPDRQLGKFLEGMRHFGLVTTEGLRGGAHLKLRLSPKGWEKSQELRSDGNQAFVAMWFAEDMLGSVYPSIKEALEECGYSSFIVSDSEEVDKIDDQIVAGIRESRILIADLTGLRPNVFYEAGLAQGLGLQVHFTCNSSYMGHYVKCQPDSKKAPSVKSAPWFEQVSNSAFDVRQYPMILWDNPDDLKRKLTQRLKAWPPA